MSTTENPRSTADQATGDPLTLLRQTTSEVTRLAADIYLAGLNALVEQQRAIRRASEQWLSGIFAGSVVGERARTRSRPTPTADIPAPTTSRPRRERRRREATSRTTPRRRGVTPAARAALADAVGPALSRWSPEGYDTLTAAEVIAKLPQFSPLELSEVEAYERAHRARRTILQRIATLRGPSARRSASAPAAGSGLAV